VHHRPLDAAPVLCVALADDDYVERPSERTKRATETHHLGMTVARVALYDEEIEVAVRARVTARLRAEQHDLDRVVRDSRQRLTSSLDDILGNHGDTVAKPADQGFEATVAAGLKQARDTFAAALSGLKHVRDSAEHGEDRVRGRAFGKKIATQPLINALVYAPGGGVMIMESLNNQHFGGTIADGTYAEGELADATTEITRAAVQAVYDAYRGGPVIAILSRVNDSVWSQPVCNALARATQLCSSRRVAWMS